MLSLTDPHPSTDMATANSYKQQPIDDVSIKEKVSSASNDVEDVEADRTPSVDVGDSAVARGTARAEGMRLVWGRNGLKIVWFGLVLMLIV